MKTTKALIRGCPLMTTAHECQMIVWKIEVTRQQ